MTVVDVYVKNKTLQNFFNKEDEDLYNLIKASCYCNDAFITYENNEFKEVGDPTETGLLRFAYQYDITKEKLLEKNDILSTLPFDSDRKMMSVLIKNDYENIMYVKGAPDIVVDKCINLDKTEVKKINDE
ncbi:UNVERIFIED_CONTAM: hypothetical protein O8I53_08520 [Campylobacter lari]